MNDSSAGSRRDPVGRALARLVARWRRSAVSAGSGQRDSLESLSAGAFRAAVDERLRSLQRQLDEVKGRVNGLLFLLAGAVATQVILRLLE
jgi:hypothetical protein